MRDGIVVFFEFLTTQWINFGGGCMELLGKIEKVWAEGAEAKASERAIKLREAKPLIANARKHFHEWEPLKVYLSYTDAVSSKSCITFSLRYRGQEVAKLKVNGKGGENPDILLVTSKKNTEYFKDIDIQGTFPWKSPEARMFRKYFKDLDPQKFKARVGEHSIESEFIRQMKEPTGRKFQGTLRGIQPALLEELPFQFPLPVSGSTGEPKSGRGNIDILARHGLGRGTKISIWELKRPKTTAHSIEQAYIYAVTLLKMLRTPDTGGIWYRDIIGFGGDIPGRITLESVVAVSIATQKNREKFEERFRDFKRRNCFSVGSDSINFRIAYYEFEDNNLKISGILD